MSVDYDQVRIEFEASCKVPSDVRFCKTRNEYVWANFPTVTAPFNEHWESFCDGWLAARAKYSAQPPAVPDSFAELVRFAYSEGQGRPINELSEFRWVDSESKRRLEAMLKSARPAKHSRSTLPDGVNRVRNVATGEITERQAVPDGYQLINNETLRGMASVLGSGCCDCMDNDGQPYQSQYLADLLAAAQQGGE